MLLLDERKLLVEYGRKMSLEQVSPGTSGNLSIADREHNWVAITPSGIDYLKMTVEDIVIIDFDGNIVEGTRKPSSEWHLHTLFYKNKPEANAVVHTHSLYCTILSTLGMPIKALHYVIGDAGTSEIPCAPYEVFGSEELAESAVKHCGASKAVLLSNHGMVAADSSLPSTYSLVKNVEYLAEVQHKAMAVGNPLILSDEQMAVVLEKFKTYGQQK